MTDPSQANKIQMEMEMRGMKREGKQRSNGWEYQKHRNQASV